MNIIKYIKKLLKIKKRYCLIYHAHRNAGERDKNFIISENFKYSISNISSTVGATITDFKCRRDIGKVFIYFYVYDELQKDLFTKALNTEFKNRIVIDKVIETSNSYYSQLFNK